MPLLIIKMLFFLICIKLDAGIENDQTGSFELQTVFENKTPKELKGYVGYVSSWQHQAEIDEDTIEGKKIYTIDPFSRVTIQFNPMPDGQVVVAEFGDDQWYCLFDLNNFEKYVISPKLRSNQDHIDGYERD